MKLLLLLLAMAVPVKSFGPAKIGSILPTKKSLPQPTLCRAAGKDANPFEDSDPSRVSPSTNHFQFPAASSRVAGLCTGLFTLVGCAVAAGEEPEMADLPPPWVPVIFALFLLAGVGGLTGSLGNVIDEEAALGLQSGARARKEMERSRSSFFKKRK